MVNGPAMLTVYLNGAPSLGRVTITRLSIYLPVIRK